MQVSEWCKRPLLALGLSALMALPLVLTGASNGTAQITAKENVETPTLPLWQAVMTGRVAAIGADHVQLDLDPTALVIQRTAGPAGRVHTLPAADLIDQIRRSRSTMKAERGRPNAYLISGKLRAPARLDILQPGAKRFSVLIRRNGVMSGAGSLDPTKTIKDLSVGKRIGVVLADNPCPHVSKLCD